MLSALAGIPMVSSVWIQLCLDSQSIVEPDSSLYIRSLPHSGPRGEDRGCGFGVAQLAADIRQNLLFVPLQDVFVYLCGSLPQNKKGDMLQLLSRAGCTLLSHSSALIAQLKKSSHPQKVVLLECGPHAKLTPAVEALVRENATKNVMVVDNQWLFDSIGAGYAREATDYEPLGGCSMMKELWKLTTKTHAP